MRNFRESLSSGKFGEVALAKCLRRAGFLCVPHDGIEYDLHCKLDDLDFTAEAKFDQMEAKTGNIAVEYYNTKQCKPSGIMATTADLWCVVLQDPVTIWICQVPDLREFLQRNKPYREVVNAGDDNAALKLYCRDIILPAVFTMVDELHPAELTDTIRGMLPCLTSK